MTLSCYVLVTIIELLVVKKRNDVFLNYWETLPIIFLEIPKISRNFPESTPENLHVVFM